MVQETEIFQSLLNNCEEPSFLILNGNSFPNNKLLKTLGHKGPSGSDQNATHLVPILHPDDWTLFTKKLHTLKTRRMVTAGPYRVMLKNGRTRSSKIYISCISPDSGIWLCQMPSKDAEKIEIDESILKFFNKDKFLDEVVLIVDFQGNILKANRKLLVIDFFAEFSDKKFNLFKFIDPMYRDMLERRTQMLLNGQHVPPCQYKLSNEDGKSAFIEIYSKCITYKGQKSIVMLVRDITLKKETEKKLLYTIVQTEEKERQRLAHDLHDELGPFLSALKLYINELQSTTNPDDKQLLFDYMHEMINEAVEKIRMIASNSTPQNMIEEGLSSYLRKMIQKVTHTGKINIEFTTKGNDEKIEPSLVITLYRILIELINNSIKHAQSTNIQIALIFAKKIRMIYTDDGLGFDLDKQIALNKGIGLKSILNRIELYQGSYKFKRLKPTGIEFDIFFPLK